MNESDLEKELRSLLPKSPSPQLAERIDAELKSPAPTVPQPAAGVLSRPAKLGYGFYLKRGALLALSGCALLAIAFWLSEPQSEKPSVTPGQSVAVAALSETPDESVDELIGATDEGLVYDGNEPQRQVRIQYLERHTWTNPQTGAVIEFEVPREDIVLMPVAMQ
jgi:hypothetical protein